MKESWDNYMKVGIVHPMCFPECLQGEGPVLDSVRRIAEDEFFSAIDVIWIKDDAVRREAGAILKNSRMDVTFAGQSVQLLAKVDLNSEDPAERKKALDLLKDCVGWAKDLNANRFSILSGKDPGDPDKRKSALDRLVEETLRICRYAREEAGLPAALKVFDFDVEKRCLIGSAEIALEYVKRVREEFFDFGLIHDLSHIPICWEKPAETVAKMKDYIVQMHMGNCATDKSHPLYGDQHPIFGVEGTCCDVSELADYIKALFEAGFLGEGRRPFVGFEIKPHAGVTSEMVIANAKRTLREAWWRL